MFGRIVSGLANQAAARQVGAVGGTAGVIAATAIPLIARRFGPLGMIGLVVGAWAAQRVANRFPANGRKPAKSDVRTSQGFE